jgi:hypothetical protein
MIPSFQTVADAAAYAAQHKPYQAAIEEPVAGDYGRRYGRLAHDAAIRCKLAARHGDIGRLHLGCIAMSLSANPPAARRQ